MLFLEHLLLPSSEYNYKIWEISEDFDFVDKQGLWKINLEINSTGQKPAFQLLAKMENLVQIGDEQIPILTRIIEANYQNGRDSKARET